MANVMILTGFAPRDPEFHDLQNFYQTLLIWKYEEKKKKIGRQNFKTPSKK